MPVSITCPSCKCRLKARNVQAIRKGKCPGCGAALVSTSVTCGQEGDEISRLAEMCEVESASRTGIAPVVREPEPASLSETASPHASAEKAELATPAPHERVIDAVPQVTRHFVLVGIGAVLLLAALLMGISNHKKNLRAIESDNQRYQFNLKMADLAGRPGGQEFRETNPESEVGTFFAAGAGVFFIGIGIAVWPRANPIQAPELTQYRAPRTDASERTGGQNRSSPSCQNREPILDPSIGHILLAIIFSGAVLLVVIALMASGK